MIARDNEALICDLAETYQIYEYRRLPARLVAVFACGLGHDSRIRRAERGETLTRTEALIATLIDVQNSYAHRILGAKKAPESILDMLEGRAVKQEDENAPVVFGTIEDYEEARRRIIEGG